MKKWNFAGIVTVILLLGSLVLLGCFFAAELTSAFVNAGKETTQTQASTTEETTIEETTTEATTQETTVEETTYLDIPPVEQDPYNEDHTVKATHAFVYDVAQDKYLYEKGDPHQRMAPASITKLLTAYVALQHLMPDTVLTVGSELSLINPNSSVAGLKQGYRLTVEMCVQGMMMPSGNDTAYVLAVAAGRKIGGDDLGAQAALDVFMDEVNRIAQLSGMTNTHFTSPDGTDTDDHYTTPHDLMILAKLASKNGVILKYTSVFQDELTITSGQTLKLKNSNLLLDPSSKFYEPRACGLKTGTTSKAGACLLSAFRKGNSFILVGTFGCPTNYARYEDTLHLYNTYK